jgi:single-stranded DNA-binding protein
MINNTQAQLEHHHQWPHSSRSDPPRSVPGTSAESLAKGARVLVVGRPKQRSWTDTDGTTHQVTEVDTEELGPSLRWATAKVTRANGTGRKTSGHAIQEPPS